MYSWLPFAAWCLDPISNAAWNVVKPKRGWRRRRRWRWRKVRSRCPKYPMPIQIQRGRKRGVRIFLSCFFFQWGGIAVWFFLSIRLLHAPLLWRNENACEGTGCFQKKKKRKKKIARKSRRSRLVFTGIGPATAWGRAGAGAGTRAGAGVGAGDDVVAASSRVDHGDGDVEGGSKSGHCDDEFWFVVLKVCRVYFGGWL